jgi:trans-aconitate methyltransferase
MRVLIPQGGTGYAGAWAAGRVAPSGAVVSLESDEESVAYAKHRYRLPNASFESGGLETLQGEVDGAFDAILAVEAIAPLDDEEARFAELWRLVRPGGWLMAAARRPADQTASAAKPSDLATVETLSDEPDGWGAVLVHKPAD